MSLQSQPRRAIYKNETFPHCIREMYSSTSKNNFSMRLVVAEIVRAHLEDLIHKFAFQRDMVKEIAEFSVDMIEGPGGEHSYRV
jgi:hypothetical protein